MAGVRLLTRHIKMKLLLTLIATTALASTVLANGHLRNLIVGANDQATTIEVREGRGINIINFIQSGGEAGSPRGTLSISRGSSPTVTVLSASFGGAESEIQKDVFIQGPATVTITPSGAAIFLSYKIVQR